MMKYWLILMTYGLIIITVLCLTTSNEEVWIVYNFPIILVQYYVRRHNMAGQEQYGRLWAQLKSTPTYDGSICLRTLDNWSMIGQDND